ncbi:hypothetical protein [Vogesella indigofera]|uniref:hypothetical protein n=1 Tax=Vogesella indigofera TaxID=45465 RepID=UPI00234D3B37|nr:hypothetical protein [Vogesella indigofera]MDC7704038.1 hypothetical protein [Vogesella indigofera]
MSATDQGAEGQQTVQETQQSNDQGSKPAKASKAAKPRTFIINIAKEKGNAGDVFIGANGVGYQVKRGVNVEVPEVVVNILRDAISLEYDPDTMEPREVPSYPFSIVGQA